MKPPAAFFDIAGAAAAIVVESKKPEALRTILAGCFETALREAPPDKDTPLRQMSLGIVKITCRVTRLYGGHAFFTVSLN